VYRIVTYPDAEEQIAALPDVALGGYAEALGVMGLVPWNGRPYNEDEPDGLMRQLTFGPAGAGFVIYLILENQQRVDVLRVVWAG